MFRFIIIFVICYFLVSANFVESKAKTAPAANKDGDAVTKGAGGGKAFPTPKGTVSFKTARRIKAGETFDGGMKSYDRGTPCLGQKEGDDTDAVFLVEAGGILRNVIIGKNQREGVHCLGSCRIENVWWIAVCEDALTLKGNGTFYVTGGGARDAKDKVIQHNGGGRVYITGFTVVNFGKLYRSCGNCKTQFKRSVVMRDITAINGKWLAGINENYGDTAVFGTVTSTKVKHGCTVYQGTSDNGQEPKKSTSTKGCYRAAGMGINKKTPPNISKKPKPTKKTATDATTDNAKQADQQDGQEE